MGTRAMRPSDVVDPYWDDLFDRLKDDGTLVLGLARGVARGSDGSHTAAAPCRLSTDRPTPPRREGAADVLRGGR